MKTQSLAKLQSMQYAPIKVSGAIAGVIGGAVVYYVKLPMKAKLVNITGLMVADVAKAITVSKATIANTTSKFKDFEVKAGAALTTAPADISDTALLLGTTGTSASSIVFAPTTDFTDAKLVIDDGECVKISIADPTTGKAISGVINLEFIPI